MTKEELDEIRERCKKATPGPWTDDGYRVYKGTNRDSPVMFEYKHSDSIGPYDGEFIAHARKDIHRLLDHIRHLERCLSIASDECDQMKEHLESQIPRWIPVSEKLPEDNQEVLFGVFDPVTQIYSGYVRNGKVLSDLFEESKEIGPWLYCMPLPSGPKER